MQQTYTYESVLAASQRASWQVEDLIGRGSRLLFGMPFLPETLARVEALSFFTPAERRVVNQIRGYEYLCTFGLVEEFILPFVLDHARSHLDSDDYRVRALLQFAGEEAKHIHLFKCFKETFERGFGQPCAFIGPAESVRNFVMSRHPLSVALAILHIEWMTQRHYVESVKTDHALDPMFKSLLKHHWMEEAQHAKLDTLMVEAIADGMSETEIDAAIDGYFAIGMFLDEGLKQQARFNLDSVERKIGRMLSDEERDAFVTSQHQAQRWTFLGSGMTHPNFLATVDHIRPGARGKIEKVAPAFC